MLRILFYSHDSFGLGHLRRTTRLAAAVVARNPGADVLILSGSPRVGAFALPHGVDVVKLPSVTKQADGSYRSRRLSLSVNETVRLRRAIICETVAAFRPSTLVVDHAPLGLGGELLPVISRRVAGSGELRLVLGLRDIIDDPARVAAGWERDGTWRHLGDYDDIVVYGDEAVGSTAGQLALSDRLGLAVRHVGYVAPTRPSDATAGDDVLVTGGGGGDAYGLYRRAILLARRGCFDGRGVRIVTGPLLSSGQRADLAELAGGRSDVTVIDHDPDLPRSIASAHAVISMAGYNTVVEELAADTATLLVPRTRPRREQEVRAQLLGGRGRLRTCSIDGLRPTEIGSLFETAAGGVTPHGVRLDGAEAAAQIIVDGRPAPQPEEVLSGAR